MRPFWLSNIITLHCPQKQETIGLRPELIAIHSDASTRLSLPFYKKTVFWIAFTFSFHHS